MAICETGVPNSLIDCPIELHEVRVTPKSAA